MHDNNYDNDLAMIEVEPSSVTASGDVSIFLRSGFPHSSRLGVWVSNFVGRQVFKSERIPRQGWKLHVSASVNSYAAVLRAVIPVIEAYQSPSKAIRNLKELAKLNSGIFYGVSQVGKAITVYCRDSNEARSIGLAIHERTRGLEHPPVPYESPILARSSVYFRYGSFSGEVLRDPDGEEMEDDRVAAAPRWALTDSPFSFSRNLLINRQDFPGQLGRLYRPVDVISARGKGCVYLAIRRSDPSQFVIVKSGFRIGEINSDGHDGQARLHEEARWLRILSTKRLPVPRPLQIYRTRNVSFLAMERPSNTSLSDLLNTAVRVKPNVVTRVRLAIAIGTALGRLHQNHIIWGDLKPSNILLNEDSRRQINIWLLDFEGATGLGEVCLHWGSPVYSAPETAESNRFASPAVDIYSFGVVLSQIETWAKRPATAISRIAKLGTPLAMIAKSCMVANPATRPEISKVLRQLNIAAAQLS